MSEHTPPQSDNADAARRLNVSGEADDKEHWLVSTSTRSRESTPGKSLRFHVPKKLPTAADVFAGISRLPAPSAPAAADVPDRAIIEPEKGKEEDEVMSSDKEE